jgi:hypothetical protein
MGAKELLTAGLEQLEMSMRFDGISKHLFASSLNFKAGNWLPLQYLEALGRGS